MGAALQCRLSCRSLHWRHRSALLPRLEQPLRGATGDAVTHRALRLLSPVDACVWAHCAVRCKGEFRTCWMFLSFWIPSPAAATLPQVLADECAVRILACVRTDVCAVPILPYGVHPGSNCVPRPPASGAPAPQNLGTERRFHSLSDSLSTAL